MRSWKGKEQPAEAIHSALRRDEKNRGFVSWLSIAHLEKL